MTKHYFTVIFFFFLSFCIIEARISGLEEALLHYLEMPCEDAAQSLRRSTDFIAYVYSLATTRNGCKVTTAGTLQALRVKTAKTLTSQHKSAISILLSNRQLDFIGIFLRCFFSDKIRGWHRDITKMKKFGEVDLQPEVQFHPLKVLVCLVQNCVPDRRLE
ncbi:hypothetical protein HG536_0H00290 [Torulaspora globosa]|uniref:Uncharacterized protein n=1 Tax=Torulaspora globosa TaxID=48254 RepID=A0A7G3ZMB9_9SACH|nr:uncharacterized protein HG536_0H00290 [Torulaspora globosa]QLL34655.1 hypothetical protein HG536_0H00290 [Torulaspora globosa]